MPRRGESAPRDALYIKKIGSGAIESWLLGRRCIPLPQIRGLAQIFQVLHAHAAKGESRTCGDDSHRGTDAADGAHCDSDRNTHNEAENG